MIRSCSELKIKLFGKEMRMSKKLERGVSKWLLVGLFNPCVSLFECTSAGRLVSDSKFLSLVILTGKGVTFCCNCHF